MKPTDLLSLSLLLSLCVSLSTSEDPLGVTCVSGETCVLPCTATQVSGVRYIALRWYKVGDPSSSHRSGLLTRDLLNGTTRWFTGLEREVELQRNSHKINLPKVACGDRGIYMCHLAAPVGEQNREGQVLLTLTDCPIEKLETDTYLVIFASAVLMIALIIFLISYGSLRNILRDRNKQPATIKETFLDAPLKPLEKKDLMLIYTLGPKTSNMKHVCV
ncbi:CD83 antigen [Mastacembelus armatus]|uniref:CD83 molecule n=1 Tax=Mastacembelus armatus TaxID=205130 RepID=A0A3Q3N648_9TELE|nr:CD83 antigen [Mastacembelus armatus]